MSEKHLLGTDVTICATVHLCAQLRHCRSQAQMRKEEGAHRQQHDTTHLQRHWTQHTQHPRECFGGREAVSRPDEWSRPCTEQTCPAAHQRWRPKGLYQQQGCRRQDGRQGGPIDRLFPSGGPAGRTCCGMFLRKTFRRVRTRCGAKASGDLKQVPRCRMIEPGVNAGGPLIGVSPQMRMRRSCWTSHMPSPDHITTTIIILTPTHTRINSLLSE